MAEPMSLPRPGAGRVLPGGHHAQSLPSCCTDRRLLARKDYWRGSARCHCQSACRSCYSKRSFSPPVMLQSITSYVRTFKSTCLDSLILRGDAMTAMGACIRSLAPKEEEQLLSFLGSPSSQTRSPKRGKSDPWVRFLVMECVVAVQAYNLSNGLLQEEQHLTSGNAREQGCARLSCGTKVDDPTAPTSVQIVRLYLL